MLVYLSKIKTKMRDKFVKSCDNTLLHAVLGFGLLILIIIS